MRAINLYVDNGNVVFGPDSSDSRDSSCAVRMVATVSDDAQDTIKLLAEVLPRAMSLPFFRLGSLGGCPFADRPAQANLTHLPWGGATSEVATYIPGPLLVNNIHNEERLVHFQERVLSPTVVSITETMITAEKAHLVKSNALAADEKQPADVRRTNVLKSGRTRTKICALEAQRAQPIQTFLPSNLPLYCWDVDGFLDGSKTARRSSRNALSAVSKTATAPASRAPFGRRVVV